MTPGRAPAFDTVTIAGRRFVAIEDMVAVLYWVSLAPDARVWAEQTAALISGFVEAHVCDDPRMLTETGEGNST